MSGVRACERFLLAAAGVAVGACAPPPPVPTPQASAQAGVVLHADGRIDFTAVVGVHLFSAGPRETFHLGDVSIGDATPGAHWTVDVVEPVAGWPAIAEGDEGLASASFRVRAHAGPFVFAHLPELFVDVAREGVDEPLHADVFLDAENATFATDPCPDPDLTPAFAALGATEAWTSQPAAFAVNDVTTLRSDPTGRMTFGTPFVLGDHYGTRLFSGAPGTPVSATEIDASLVDIAPGNGSGPIVSALLPVTDTLWVQWVTRFDPSLNVLWSHEIVGVGPSLSSVIASTQGRVLVAAAADGGVVINGLDIPDDGLPGDTLLLLDDTTGEVLATSALVDPIHATGLPDGGFAIVTRGDGIESDLVVLDVDLTERFRVPLGDVVGGVLPLGVDATPDGHLWVGHDGGVLELDASGVLVREFASTQVTSFAVLGDGSVIVVSSAGLSHLADGALPKYATLPAPAAPWCAARVDYRVARGPAGPVYVAKPIQIADVSMNGATFFGALSF